MMFASRVLAPQSTVTTFTAAVVHTCACVYVRVLRQTRCAAPAQAGLPPCGTTDPLPQRLPHYHISRRTFSNITLARYRNISRFACDQKCLIMKQVSFDQPRRMLLTLSLQMILEVLLQNFTLKMICSLSGCLIVKTRSCFMSCCAT